MLKKPRTAQDDSDKGQFPATTADIVSGMLRTETSRSAAESPRMNMFVTVRSSCDLQTIIHSETLPPIATTMMRQIMMASMMVPASIGVVQFFIFF